MIDLFRSILAKVERFFKRYYVRGCSTLNCPDVSVKEFWIFSCAKNKPRYCMFCECIQRQEVRNERDN